MIFTDTNVPLSLQTAAGTAVDIRTVNWDQSCTAFATVRIARLEQGQTYRIGIGPTSHSPMVMFIDHLDSFGSSAWSRPCRP